jgi:hypothetical protein
LFHVDLHGKLAVVVDLELGHGVKVEFEAFEYEEHDVGHALDAAPLQRVDFLLALLTVIGVVTLQHLSLHERLETLLDRVLVLYLQTYRHERLFSLRIMRAALANEFISQHSLEKILDDFLFFFAFDKILDSIHGHIEEFIDIFLDHGIDGTAVDVLESSAEVFGVKILTLDLHEPAEYHLELMQNVLLSRLLAEVAVFNFHDRLFEGRDHEKLLHD